MQLLIENQKATINDGLMIVESVTESGTKQLFIEGIFAQSEVKNGNGRKYPKAILTKAVNEYNEKFINNGKSIGEFNHPAYPKPNWKEAAIMIKELKMVGNDAHGKALVLDTEKGKHLKALIEGGYNVGVSTRGLGNTKINESTGLVEVTEYYMTAVDTVDDPSAPDAHVKPLYESKGWQEENGEWVQKQDTDDFTNSLCEAFSKLYK